MTRSQEGGDLSQHKGGNLSQRLRSNSEQIEFKLPPEGRSWPLYVKKSSLHNGNYSDDVIINFSIINDSNEEIELKTREIDSNSVKSILLKKMEESLLYSGKLTTFIMVFNKDNLLRQNENGNYDEWHPLISISSVSGGKIDGWFKLISQEEINLIEPLILYTYLPSDTL